MLVARKNPRNTNTTNAANQENPNMHMIEKAPV